MQTIQVYALLLFFALMPAIIVKAGSSDTDQEAIKALYEKYTSAVRAADMEGMFETVSGTGGFNFLTTSGRLIEGLNGYKEFHKEWFAETGWKIEFTEPKIYVVDDTAYTMAKFFYKSEISGGEIETLESWFTMICKKEKGAWKVVADICTPVSRMTGPNNSNIIYTKDQVYFFDILKNRRTVRKFKTDPVPEEHIMKILDAARLAPTSGNQQPWKFLVVRDRKKIDELKATVIKWIVKRIKEKYHLDESVAAEKGKNYESVIEGNLSAPVLIVVLVDSKSPYPDYIHTDGDLAVENLMLAARALGYGTGYYTSFYPEEIIKPLFNIPDNYKLICVTPVGIPENWPPMPPKKDIKDLVVFESIQ
jgi:nitroreductase/ketosteroid isomerase-like protein